MNERQQLEQALRRARRRLDEAAPYSPEWQAAIEAVVDLQRRVTEATAEFVVA